MTRPEDTTVRSHMSTVDAWKEANRRWVRAWVQKFTPRADKPDWTFEVGCFGVVKGNGSSWEAAFADADRRERGA